MKKFLLHFLPIVVILVIIVLILNINVTTRQGINYQWHTIKLPLYLKILDFFDRHYNYKQLVKGIVKDAKVDQERVMRIFEWTYKNLKKAPEGLPLVDDHVWYIIVRGYGADDQFQDVFTTLCNYAGVEAFYLWVSTQDRTKSIPLSFVKLEGSWCVFDPYHTVYFKDEKGRLASIETLKSNKGWVIEALYRKPEIDYASFFSAFPSLKDRGLTRANTQSPFKRLLFELNKLKKH